MKRLSLLVALMLAVTIGGVYATWNYAQGKTDYREKYVKATMTDKVSDTAKGTIEVDTSGLSIIIDEDPDVRHTGKLLLSGKIVITFTPISGADDVVMESGIPMQFQLGLTENFNYGGEAIFTVNNEIHALAGGASTMRAEITAEQLGELITLNTDTVYLPTVEDYSAFKNALATGSIQITVSEAPTAVVPQE